MKKALLILVTVLSVLQIYSQAWMQYLPQNRDEQSLTYYDYQAAFNEWCRELKIDQEGYYINKNGARQKAYGWKQFKRWEIEMDGWYDRKTGRFLYNEANKEILRVNAQRALNPRNISGTWTPVAYAQEGSGNDGNGRINCVAFHPTDPDVFWAGTAWGGIWKTEDHGNSWAPLSDDIMTLGIGSIAIPFNYDQTQTIYLGTGDRGYNRDMGRGILKSTDGGQSWQQTGLSYDTIMALYINKLMFVPGTANQLIACTDEGVFYSSDGFQTWDTLLTCFGVDMEFNPGNPNIIYVSTRGENKITKIYRTENGGITWNPVMSTYGIRTELAVSPDEPSWVYAVVADTMNSFMGFLKSENNGNSFNTVFDDFNILGDDCNGWKDEGQANYDLAIAANPLNADHVYVGGINVWKSTTGGTSWNINTNGYRNCGVTMSVHVDIHWLDFQHLSDSLFVTSDGGIYFSPNNGISYTNISGGLQINQPYGISCSQLSSDEILMGQQDNGVVLWNDGDIDFVGGGDGGTTLINPLDANNQFYSNNSEYCFFTTNHWANSHTFSTPGDNTDDWFKPIAIRPPDTVYFGAHDLWKSTEKGYNMTKIMDLWDTTTIRDIAIAPSDPNIIFVVNSENLWRTQSGGSTFLSLTSNLPVSPDKISTIEIKETDPDVVWISVADGWGTTNQVFRSGDRGMTWANISDGLPKCRIADIIQNDLQTNYEELYATCWFGIYVKLGDYQWMPFNEGLPDVISFDIDIYYSGSNSKLRAGTHGRGVWESPLFSADNSQPFVWTGQYSSDWNDLRNWNFMTVPSTDIDVIIPEGTARNAHIYTSNASCRNIVIENGALLNISNKQLVVISNMDIHGDLKFYGENARMLVEGNIAWKSGCSFEASETNCLIEVEGDWTFDPGVDVELDGTRVIFSGSGFSNIYYNSELARFGSLIVAKPANNNVFYSDLSTCDFLITGDLIINPGGEFYQSSNKSLNIWGDLNSDGDFFQQHGTCRYKSDATIRFGSSSSYFNIFIIDHGASITMLSNIKIREDLFIGTGALNIGSNILKLGGNLSKDDEGLLSMTSGSVEFNGQNDQFIMDDFAFGSVNVNKVSDTLHITTGRNVVFENYDWTIGIVSISQNSHLEIGELVDDGICGTYRVKDSGTLDIHNPTGSVDLNGNLYIEGGYINIYGGNDISLWPGNQDAQLWIDGGVLDFKDQGIHLNDNYNLLEVIAGGVIRTTGSFIGERNDFTPVGGYVELYGNGNVSLSHGIGGGLFDLHINKSTSSDKVSVIQNLDIDRNLSVLSGNLDINGRTVDVAGDADITGKLSMTLESSELNVVSDITWLPGSSSNITNGQISFRGNWTYSNGTNASLTGANTLTVEGSSNSLLLNNDPDASFANFTCNKSSLMTMINQSSVFPIYINGNLTLMSGNLFTPGAIPVFVNGITTVQATSNILLGSSGQLMLNIAQFENVQDIPSGVVITVNELVVNNTMNLASDGFVASDDLVLNGILNVNGGDMLIHGDFLQNSSGHLTLNSGSFILDKPYTGNMFGFSGTTDLNGGFFEITNEGIQFGTGAIVNFNGGNLRVGGHFRAVLPDSFQPTAGAIELINTIGASIECSNGNYFHDLIIYKTGGNPSILVTPVTINNNLLLNRGSLTTLNQTLTVDGDLTIESLANLAAGSSDIYIGGGWNNKRGTSGFSEGTSTVTFNTAQSGTLGSETFYRLEVDKFAPSGVHLTLNEGSVLTVSNDFTASLGSLKLSNNSTFNAQGMVHLKDGGGIYAPAAAQNVLLNFYGDWKNYNPVTDEYHGFEPGNSTTNICGNADQDLIAPFGTSFGKLVLLKTGGNFLPSGDITVMGDLDLQSGNWSYATTGLVLTLRKNMTIGSSANWFDNLNAVVFAGGGIHYLQNNNPSLLSLGKIVIDQQYDFEQDLDFRILNDFTCNIFRINNGYTTIDNLDVICNDSLLVGNSGSCLIYNGTVLKMGDAANIHVNGGNLTFAGSTANPSLVTRKNSAYYEFLVENQGSLNAINAIFEYLDDKGINLDGNGIIEGEFPLYNCTFRNGKPGGYFLLLNNSQDVTLYNVNFQTNAGFGAKNAAKSVSTGNVRFTDAYGDFAGPAYEYDPNNRIHWPGAGIWEGDVSTAWHNPLNWHFDFQVPDASTDVVIPSGKPNYPVFSLEDTTIHSLFMEPNTSLTITKDSLTVTSWADIAGVLNFSGDYTALFTDSLVWQSGSSASMVSRSTIYLTGDMFVKRGSNLALNDGTIYFYGNNESNLRCHDTAQIFNLSNYKNSAYSLNLAGDTAALLTINGNFVNGTSATLKCPSTQEWVFNGNFRNTANGHFRCSNGTIKLRGPITSTYFRLNHGDYFNNLTIETPSRVNLYYFTGYSDTLRVYGDLTINPRAGGTSGIQANQFKIIMLGDWINNAGTSAFVTGVGQTHSVVFWDPYERQELRGNTNFNYVGIANESDEGVHCYDQINISSMVVTNPLWSHGILSVSNANIDDNLSSIHIVDGSVMQINSLYQGGLIHMHGGSLTIEDLVQSYISGNYIVDNGLLFMKQNDYSSTFDLYFANLTINGGELRLSGGINMVHWPSASGGVSNLTMTGGLFYLMNHHIGILPGNFNENISGGTIRLPGSFTGGAGVTSFNPTGGIVELYDDWDADCGFVEPASWFYDLNVNKADEVGVFPSGSLRVKHELKLISGDMQIYGNPVFVGP